MKKGTKIFAILVSLVLIAGVTIAFETMETGESGVYARHVKAKAEEKAKSAKEEKAKAKAEAVAKVKAARKAAAAKPGKKVYLTFDDGPSTNNTLKILKMLKKHNAHATFFVVGSYAKAHPAIIKKAYKEGNQIAVHTWSHNYNKIYSSQAAFFKDFNKTEKLITRITGEKPTACRLPGGSNNSFLKRSTAVKIVKKLRARGYTVVDWNAATNDATGINYSASQMAHFAINGIRNQKKPVVLSHDSAPKVRTTRATAAILSFCSKKKYNCVTIDAYKGKVPLFIGI